MFNYSNPRHLEVVRTLKRILPEYEFNFYIKTMSVEALVEYFNLEI